MATQIYGVPGLFRDSLQDFVPLQIMLGLALECVQRPVLDKIHLTAVQDSRVVAARETAIG